MLLDQQNTARPANLLLDQHFFCSSRKILLDQHLFLDYGISQSELLLYLPFCCETGLFGKHGCRRNGAFFTSSASLCDDLFKV